MEKRLGRRHAAALPCRIHALRRQHAGKPLSFVFMRRRTTKIIPDWRDGVPHFFGRGAVSNFNVHQPTSPDGRPIRPRSAKKLKESIEICDVVHTWKESSPKDPPTSGANYISTGFGSVSATFWIERGGSAADVMGLPAWRCVAFEPGPSATAKGASPFVWVWGRFGMDLTALHALRVQPF